MTRVPFLTLAFAATLATAGATSQSAAAREAGAIAPLPQTTSSTVLAATNSDVTVGARHFVDSMGARAISFLSDPALGQEQRKTRFRTLLRDSYDMDTISRFALGRYWRLASAAQRREYRKLFEDMVVNVYARRFSEYKGQKFLVRSQRAEGANDTIVTSAILPTQGPEVRVDWRVRFKNGQYRIVDVIVEGVSMAMTQRSDFSSVIQKGGGDVQVLIDHLRNQTQ